MKNFDWKKILPHLYAIGIFLIVSVIFCSPALQGKVLQQSDVTHWKGMAQNLFKYKEIHGYFPLWTNSMFGGMPAYQIAMEVNNPVSLGFFHKIFMLFLPKPISYFFLLCITFYFLSQVIRVKPWLGILGAIAYAFASFSCIIVAVGHETQMLALGYVPAVLGGLFLLYDKKYLLGGALTALFTSLLIGMNHLQITYYFIIIAVFATIGYAIEWIKSKQYKHMVLALSIAVVAGGLGALANIVPLATTLDYSKATMRNGTLNLDTTAASGQKKSGGLPIDYAFNWSYGIAESFTLMVPGIYGGSSNGELKGSSNLAKHATDKGIPEDQAAQFASQFPSYWGNQPFTSGPVYLGAVICFLFIFSLFYVKSFHKWWILAACVMALMMSWGKNFAGFNTFLFDYLPLYNKFRVPTMTLVIPQLLFPLLAIMGLEQFLFRPKENAEATKDLKFAGYATAGVFVILAFLYLSFDYHSASDENTLGYFKQVAQGNEQEAKGFYSALLEDRKSLFGGDLLRSILLVCAAFALLWMVLKNKIKPLPATIALLVISSFDLFTVDKRYLSENNYQDAETVDESSFAPSEADLMINKDTSYYRVINLTQDVFNDAITSYHHNSVGGYHPAKLSIVEDLLNYQLRKQPMNLQVLDMLNTKYIITADPKTGKPVAQTNPEALGAAWFVKTIRFVNTPAAAMKALDNIHAKDTAIVETTSKEKIPFLPQPDSSASIRLIKNDNDYIEYQTNNPTNQFAVFSEIYYDRGWKAYIDGKESPIVQTNYVLRGLAVPPGQHKITFEFKPASYYTSGTIGIIASILIWLALISSVVRYYLSSKKKINQA